MRRGSRSLINGIHHNTPVAPHYRPIYPKTLYHRRVCVMYSSVLCTGPPSGGKQGGSIYNHPTGGALPSTLETKSADTGEIFQPQLEKGKNSCHSGKKLLILLKFMNIWNCAWQNRGARVSMCGNLGLGHISRSKRARRCIWLLDVCEGGVSSELVQEKNYMKKELIFVDKIIPD